MKPLEDVKVKEADEVQKTKKKAKKVKVIIKQEEIIDFANLIVKSGKVNKVESIEEKPIVISPTLANPNILSMSPHDDIITSPLKLEQNTASSVLFEVT